MKKLKKNKWFLIIAKDCSCQGYMPGKDKEEACCSMGMSIDQCSVKEVAKTDEGFVEPNQSEQGKLL